MPVQFFFLSFHYQVEQLIFLFPHHSLLNNMHPNHEFSVAILRMKRVPGEIATPSPSLPPHHTISSLPIALKASESSPPVAASLISQMECLWGDLSVGRSLVGAFNFTSGWGKRMQPSKHSTNRTINRPCNARKSPGVLKMILSSFQGVWLRREVIIVTSHWSGWG